MHYVGHGHTIHRFPASFRGALITTRDVRYGTGPIVTHDDAWVIYSHGTKVPVRRPAFTRSCQD